MRGIYSNSLLVFLSALEALILNGSLDYLSNEMISELLQFMNSKGVSTRMIEKALMKLDHKNIDLNFVIKVCEDKQMYSALIYFLSEGLLDFFAPVSRLCELLKSRDLKVSELLEIEKKVIIS